MPAEVELSKGLHRQPSSSDYLEAAERQLREIQRDAEENWTPGQAFGVILDYLDRVEDFSGSSETALQVKSRMRWLTKVLHGGVERAIAIGLDPNRLNGVFDALVEHDALLSTERSIAAPSVIAARELIRLEISYIIPNK